MEKNSINYVTLLIDFVFFSLIFYLLSAIPTLQTKITTTTALSPIPSNLPSINITSPSPSGGQSGHMLRLIEPQLSSSYRRAFVPYYQRAVIPTLGIQPSSSIAQRKMSIVSSRRMSSVLGLRKRESNASQLGILTTQDGQTRLSLPPAHKQHRQSIVSPRLSDSDMLTKLRAKNMVTVQN